MGIFAFTDAKVTLNGVDISDHCTSAQIKANTSVLDATAMSAGAWEAKMAGLKTWTLELELNNDFSASVDALLWDLMGTSFSIAFRPVRSSITATTNPEYWGSVTGAYEYSTGGKVGDLAKTTVTLTGTGALTRSTSRTGSYADIVYIGDSITEGYNSTIVAGFPNSWISKVTASLRTLVGATGGTGYMPAYFGLGNGSRDPYGFAATGSVTQDTVKGLGRHAVTLNSSGASITATVLGTSIDVFYTRNTGLGTFSVSIDGGSATNISCAAAPYAYGGYTQRISMGSAGWHTVTIAYVSGTTPTVEGVMVYNGDENSGIRQYEAARAGYTAASFASNATWPQSLQGVTLSNTRNAPAVVVIALGTNDFRANIAPATYGSHLTTIIGFIRAAAVPGGSTVAASTPIVLVHLEEPADGTYTYTWASYLAQVQAVAAAAGNCTVVDISAIMAKGVNLDTDNLHPLDAGHTVIANAVASAIRTGPLATAIAAWVTT